ncbi:MAG: AtpZ/AtpI family protein [Ruminiclostridium sp.]|nr:AtpZ/AtpI family protein [Ruminiclostridium sp.]
MANNKKDNPIAVYAVVSQIGFIIIGPLLVFVIGGTALVNWLEWPDWVNFVFVAVGILTMLAGAFRYLKQLIKMFDKSESGVGTSEARHDRRDHDYYDDSIKKKRL